MSVLKRLGGRLPDFADVIRRFPIAVLVMAAFTLWIIADNHFSLTSYRNRQFIASGFILAGYSAVIVTLMTEARRKSAALGIIAGGAISVVAFLLCYFARHIDFTYAMAIGAVILFLGNAAAWRAGRDDRNVWNFTQKLWTGALFATVGSIIFLLGMLAISEAVRALFGFNLDDLTMETILPIGLAFLAPIYWLGTLPRYGEAQDVTELSFEARALSFLGTWMLAPLVIVYALIVLAYGGKVLIQWELPKGEIGGLVSPFLCVGMLVWLMLEPKVLKESGFVRFYRKVWHWIMLPAAILLGVAVFVRIRALGYTPERFFLTLLTSWAIVQSLWFTIMPLAKRDIRVPTALAAGLLVIGAFGAQPLSAANQLQRAEIAKRDFPAFNADAIRENPEQAARFLSGLKYLIQQDDKTRFERLLPDREMPMNAYGDEYITLIRDLGLEGLSGDEASRWQSHEVRPQQPILIDSNSTFHVASSVNLYQSRTVKFGDGIIASQNARELVLNIDGETYQVDFDAIFSDVDLSGLNSYDSYIVMPASEIMSDSDAKASLVVLSGRLNFDRELLTGGTITFGVIVPN